MRGQRAISGRRARRLWPVWAGAIVFLSAAILGGQVRAANWSNPGGGAHAVSTAPVVTTTAATVSGTGTLNVPGLNVTASITASDTVTTTAKTIVSANGSTATTTATSYGLPTSLTGITVSGTYTVAGVPTPVPFAYSFPSLTQAAQAALAQGYNLVVTPSSTTNTVTISLVPSNPELPTANATLTLGAPSSSTTSTPAPPPPMPLTPSHGPPSITTAQGAPAAASVEDELQAAADEAQTEIARCNSQTPPCVADALEAYAARLEQLAPQLPRKMRALPGIIRQAARKARVAKTRAEAVRAVQTAIVQVRHTVQLLRAEDPDAQALGRRVGEQAIGVLQAASAKLERATEL
jgi:hypothetical protein